MQPTGKIIRSIGHSNHATETFIDLLRSFDIRLLADIRSFPGSARYPQFNKSSLQQALTAAGISYLHFPALGGRRQYDQTQQPVSGYKGYMQTTDFQDAAGILAQKAMQYPTAYMCAEADWRHCHRAHVSGYFTRQGWQVIHIAGNGGSSCHTTTAQGSLF